MIEHRAENNDGEDPPIPFHSSFLMGGFAELAGDEFIIIEIIAGKIQSVCGGILLPGFFPRPWFFIFFGAAGAALADRDFGFAKRANVAQGFGHG